MSKVKKSVKLDPVLNGEKPEKKKRVKKAPPTKAEQLASLTTFINELKQIIIDLKDDQMKVSSMPLKKIPELMKETLSNLEEDLQGLNEQYDELLKQPETQPCELK